MTKCILDKKYKVGGKLTLDHIEVELKNTPNVPALIGQLPQKTLDANNMKKSDLCYPIKTLINSVTAYYSLDGIIINSLTTTVTNYTLSEETTENMPGSAMGTEYPVTISYSDCGTTATTTFNLKVFHSPKSVSNVTITPSEFNKGLFQTVSVGYTLTWTDGETEEISYQLKNDYASKAEAYSITLPFIVTLFDYSDFTKNPINNPAPFKYKDDTNKISQFYLDTTNYGELKTYSPFVLAIRQIYRMNDGVLANIPGYDEETRTSIATAQIAGNSPWTVGENFFFEVDYSLTIKAEVVQKPTTTSAITYNSSSQSPIWANYDSSKMTIGGTTSAINVGNYDTTFTCKDGYVFPDGSTTTTITWTIKPYRLEYEILSNTHYFYHAGESYAAEIPCLKVPAWIPKSLFTIDSTELTLKDLSYAEISSDTNHMNILFNLYKNTTTTIGFTKNELYALTVKVNAAGDSNYEAFDITLPAGKIKWNIYYFDWDNATWEQIHDLCQNAIAPSVTVPDTSPIGHLTDYVKVGNKKDVAVTGTIPNFKTKNTYNVVIIGINLDGDNTITCKGTESFRHIVKDDSYNLYYWFADSEANENIGWSTAFTLEGTFPYLIRNKIPQMLEVYNYLVPTKRTAYDNFEDGTAASTPQITINDKVFLLTYYEYGLWDSSQSRLKEGNIVYPYFTNYTSRIIFQRVFSTWDSTNSTLYYDGELIFFGNCATSNKTAGKSYLQYYTSFINNGYSGSTVKYSNKTIYNAQELLLALTFVLK